MSQDATKMTSAIEDTTIYLFTKMMTLYMYMVAITIPRSVSSSVSPCVVATPTSKPTGILRMKNLCQEPISEYDYCKEEEQYDSELEKEDDGWPGTENHWSPLLDLHYHYSIDRSLLGFMEEMDLASISATCQLAIFIALLWNVTSLRNMCGRSIISILVE